MTVIYNPSSLLDRLLPADSSDLLTSELKFKQKFKKALLKQDFISGKDLNYTVNNTLRFYKHKIKRLKNEGDRSFKKDALNNEKLLYTRLENLILESVHDDILENYEGEPFIWLPSSAENPDPEHALNYGKRYIIGKDEIPGDRWGCKCGMRILTKDDADYYR